MSKLEVNAIEPEGASTTLTLGASGDTVTVPSGATLTSVGDVSIDTGNLVIGTAGKGIDFSAQTSTTATGAAATSEVLDHYEEGTWTPSIGGNATYTNQVGRYIKIGNMVWINFALAINVQGTGSTISSISGLPFASGLASQNTSNLNWYGLGVAMTYGVYYVGAGQSALSLSYSTSAATQLTNNPNSLVNGAQMFGSFAYTV